MKKVKLIFNYIILLLFSLILIGCTVEDKYSNLRKALNDTIETISSNYNLEEITDDISLIGTNENYIYQFISSNEEVISNTGKVNRQLEVTTVIITVRVYQEEIFIQDKLECTVLPVENPNQYKELQDALDETINNLKTKYDLNNLTTNIDLVGTNNNCTYQFFSNNENVLSSKGIINRQTSDIEVIITIKIFKDDLSLQETIEVIVKGIVISDGYTYDVENTKSKLKVSDLKQVNENEEYNNYLDVIAYIFYYHKLPKNYLTKSQAKNLGWKGSGNVWVNNNLRGKNIGGDVFNNYEQILPILSNRPYIEVDVNCSGGSRGKYRIVYNKYTFDIYYTDDHYETFTYMIGAIE